MVNQRRQQQNASVCRFKGWRPARHRGSGRRFKARRWPGIVRANADLRLDASPGIVRVDADLGRGAPPGIVRMDPDSRLDASPGHIQGQLQGHAERGTL